MVADHGKLRQTALKIRRNIIKMLAQSQSGHPGGSLSATDIITTLYFHEMNFKLNDPDRDRFILSKGHAAPALYSALAELGIIPEQELMTLRTIDSNLQGHPDRLKTPGVEASTGSLGQGLSIANGMALAGKLDNRPYRVYALLGDGECQEGQVWEAAMTASHYKLDNVVGIVDHNRLQIDGECEDIMNVGPLDEKFKAFGWHVITVNGHSFEQLTTAFDEARTVQGKPTMIIANTIKGKGVSFMENVVGFHGKAPSQEQAEKALEELA